LDVGNVKESKSAHATPSIAPMQVCNQVRPPGLLLALACGCKGLSVTNISEKPFKTSRCKVLGLEPSPISVTELTGWKLSLWI